MRIARAWIVVACLAGCGSDNTYSCDVYWGGATKIEPDTTTDETAANGSAAVTACEADKDLQMEADRATGNMQVTCTCM